MTQDLNSVMRDYLNEGDESSPSQVIAEGLFSISTCDAPVQPAETSTWEIVSDPTRFMKEYEFSEYSALSDFLQELMDHQENIQHHAKLTVNHRSVIVEVYTHDVNDITEIDREFTQVADTIYDNIAYYDLSDRINEYERGI